MIIIFEVLGEYLGEIIIGASFLGVSWIFKGMLKESFIEFAKLVWDKERMKDQAVNQVLSIEANKWHGKEVDDPTDVPKIKPAIEIKLDNIYDVVSNFRSEVGNEIANISNQVSSFRVDFDEYTTSSNFRLDRLEEYNLTHNQIESYKQKATDKQKET